jgi:hypothetical protein
MRGSGQKRTLTVPGWKSTSGNFMNASALGISPAYFKTLGIPLLEGRTLNDQDRQVKPQPIIVNRALANMLFPNADPIGRAVILGSDTSQPPDYRVVGVVANSKYRFMEEALAPIMYMLMEDENYSAVLYVRTAGNPLDIIRPAEREIRKMGGGVTLVEAQTLEQDVQNSLWQERLVAGLACFFSFVALLLAAIGLYGTLAYSVARRRRELGIRIALGAQVRHILGTVCGKMTWAVGCGILAGWAVSAIGLRFARSFLFEVQPFDGLSFSTATVAVLLCAALAAAAPAWRAIRTNASIALREQ